MPWSLDSCAAFLTGRRRRAKYEQQPDDSHVEQATANPGEKRDLPRCTASSAMAGITVGGWPVRCSRRVGHEGPHTADESDIQWR